MFYFFEACVTLCLRRRNIALLFCGMRDLGLAEMEYRFVIFRYA